MVTVRFILPAEAANAVARPVVGQGGFQGRLDTVLEELKKLGEVLRPLSDAS